MFPGRGPLSTSHNLSSTLSLANLIEIQIFLNSFFSLVGCAHVPSVRFFKFYHTLFAIYHPRWVHVWAKRMGPSLLYPSQFLILRTMSVHRVQTHWARSEPQEEDM